MIARWLLLPTLIAALISSLACDHDERIAKLEKQVQELDGQVKKSQAATDFGMQAKCSKDSRGWFNDNFSTDKDTILLTFTNHYSKSSNKCFIEVEWHYKEQIGDSWMNNMTLWDVYENTKYGTFSDNHVIYRSISRDEVIECDVYGKKCATIDEFNQLAQPYLNN